MFVQRFLAAALLLCASALPGVAEDLRLVMVEQAGCQYCEIWDAEISHIYPKTEEGRRAPLRRVDLHAPMPDDLVFKGGFHYTPTFVLMADGREVSRLEGYPGEDFFWGLLGQMLGDLPQEGAPKT